MRRIVCPLAIVALSACVGRMPGLEEGGGEAGRVEKDGFGEPPERDPGTYEGADLVVGSPVCAPCSSDADCGEGTGCTEWRGVCEHRSGYCDSNSRGLRSLETIDRIVIHTMEGYYEGGVGWFLSPSSRVSAHYLVGADGRVGALLSEAAVGKHTANVELDGRSIGIELEGFVDRPVDFYTPEAYEATAALVRDVAARYDIPLDRGHVIGHVEVPDPTAGAEFCGGWSHHSDPGDGFDWEYLMALVRGEPAPDRPTVRWLERAPFDPELLDVAHPSSVAPGEELEVSLRLRNDGRYVWEQSRLRLVASDDGARELFLYGGWASRDLPELDGLGCTGPDRLVELTFRARAPEVEMRRVAGGGFHLELRDRLGVRHVSGDFYVLFEVLPEGAEPPPDDPGPGAGWGGLSGSGALAEGEEDRYETPPLPPGDYRFEITGEGDADLYVRAGAAPTLLDYDCRPYHADASETCDVTLSEEAPVFVMVRGYRACSYALEGRAM